jgi:hypothetical protein
MGAIVIRTRYDEGTESAEVANNNIFSFVAMSADSVPSSKTNIYQNKLIYCRHFRTYWRCAMFEVATSGEKKYNIRIKPESASGLFCLLLILVHNICY